MTSFELLRVFFLKFLVFLVVSPCGFFPDPFEDVVDVLVSPVVTDDVAVVADIDVLTGVMRFGLGCGDE